MGLIFLVVIVGIGICGAAMAGWLGSKFGGFIGGKVYDIFFRKRDRHNYMMEKFKRLNE
jgi:hypothetical protein